MQFIMNNLANIIVCAILLLIATAIIRWMIHNKKKGKSLGGCGGDCSHCKGCH